MRWLRAKCSVTRRCSTHNDHHYYHHTYYSKVSITYLWCYTGHKYHVIYYVLCCALSLQLCPTLWALGPQPARLLCPWDVPGKNTGVGCHFLFQGIFPNQGWNLRVRHLLHCRRILYHWATRETHVIYYNNENIPHVFLMLPSQRQTLSRGNLIILNKVPMKVPKFISFPFNTELLSWSVLNFGLYCSQAPSWFTRKGARWPAELIFPLPTGRCREDPKATVCPLVNMQGQTLIQRMSECMSTPEQGKSSGRGGTAIFKESPWSDILTIPCSEFTADEAFGNCIILQTFHFSKSVQKPVSSGAY